MTVQTTTNVATAIGNGVASDFPFDFLIPEGEAEVRLTTIATGAEGLPLTLGVDYTIVGEDNPAGGYVHYPISGTKLPSTQAISIRRVVPLIQTLDLTTQSSYFPEQLEGALDRIVFMAQQNAEKLSRAVLIGAGSTATPEQLVASLLSASSTVAASVVAAQAAEAGALAAQAAAEAAAGGMLPVETQIGAATDTDFLDADFLTARKTSNGTLIKRSWANVKALLWAAWGALIIGGTAKATPVDADAFAMADTAAGNATKKVLWSAVKATMYTALGPLIAATTAKAAPVNADGFLIADSAASNANKLLTFTNLKSFLKTYFDTVYQSLGVGALTLLTEQATTSGTTKDFTIPAGAKRIMVLVNGVVRPGNGGALGIQIGDSGGIETSGYSGAAGDRFPFNTSGGGTPAAAVYNVVTMTRVNATHSWIFDAGSGGGKTLSAELTTVRLICSGGSFTGGSVNVMYE